MPKDLLKKGEIVKFLGEYKGGYRFAIPIGTFGIIVEVDGSKPNSKRVAFFKASGELDEVWVRPEMLASDFAEDEVVRRLENVYENKMPLERR